MMSICATIEEHGRGLERRRGGRGLGLPRGITVDVAPWPTAIEYVKPMTPNKSRSRAKLASRTHLNPDASALPQLAGLRVLGVDLGRKLAAGCAEWETLAKDDLAREIAGRTIVAGGIGAGDGFVHTVHRDSRTGREQTTVYRRIAADLLPDGSPRAAPWARLERQFVIGIEGASEDRTKEGSRRLASPDEQKLVAELMAELGYGPAIEDPVPAQLDALTWYAVRLTCCGLRRHDDAARIGRAFSIGAARSVGNVHCDAHSPEERFESVLDALVRWAERVAAGSWADAWASRAWSAHIGCEVVGVTDDPTPLERATQRKENAARLASVARRLASSDTGLLGSLWTKRWQDMDAGWEPRLRALRTFVHPSWGGLPATCDADARDDRHASVVRIAAIRDLGRLHEAYAMRPRPEDQAERGAGQRKEPDRHREIARAIFGSMDRLRARRGAEIASRVLAAAVDGDRPSHVIAISDVADGRVDRLDSPHVTQEFVAWCASGLREHLAEGCRQEGVALRTVGSKDVRDRSCRTGSPGLPSGFFAIDPGTGRPSAFWWEHAVWLAERREEDGIAGDYERALVGLGHELANARISGEAMPGAVQLACLDGELFAEVSSLPRFNAGCAESCVESCAESCASTQVDINAAANVGLRALGSQDVHGSSHGGSPFDPAHHAACEQWLAAADDADLAQIVAGETSVGRHP